MRSLYRIGRDASQAEVLLGERPRSCGNIRVQLPEDAVGYTLDQVAEQLIHSLSELLVFRDKILLEPECSESVILNDAIEDLAKGLGLHCGLQGQGDASGGELKRFVGAVRECTCTLHVAQVFKRTPGLAAYLTPPYFSQSDLQRLE